MNQVFNKDELNKVHEPSPHTKTVVLRKCWTIVFNVNGNAPSDAPVVSCASQDLAEQVLTLFAAQKDDNKVVGIIIGGKKHFNLPEFSVEGYNFDTFYEVREDWQDENQIIKSLAELATMTDCEEVVASTVFADGIVLDDGEDDSEDDSEDDGEWSE